MVTWAMIVGAVFGGLWLLTWVVQIAAYVMLAIAWISWGALKLTASLMVLALAGGVALFGTAKQKQWIRRNWADAQAQNRARTGANATSARFSSASMLRSQVVTAG